MLSDFENYKPQSRFWLDL